MKPASVFDDEQDVYEYQPKTKEELIDIIKKCIREKGRECDLNGIDVSHITDMSYLFYNLDFNGDISDWDVSKVTDMFEMFFCSKFNGDLSGWKISNVKDMYGMFADSSFNQDISKWQIKYKCNVKNMFENCPIDEKYKPKF